MERVACVAETIKGTVAMKGGIEAVVAAIRRHKCVPSVAEEGCGALANIASLGEFAAVAVGVCHRS